MPLPFLQARPHGKGFTPVTGRGAKGKGPSKGGGKR